MLADLKDHAMKVVVRSSSLLFVLLNLLLGLQIRRRPRITA
jgi:hypothetical protein